eukprot:1388952-Amorphochlora_amoeboformis.AAC.1
MSTRHGTVCSGHNPLYASYTAFTTHNNNHIHLQPERAKLEMSWLEDRLELSQSLLEHVKHHQ